MYIFTEDKITMILENDRKKVTIIKTIFIIVIAIAIIVGSVFLLPKIQKYLPRNSQESSTENPQAESEAEKDTEPTIFALSNILLYSSANAINNSDTQKDYWNLGIYQYTDISITIDNHVYSSKLTSKNLVTKLYIDNINFSAKPKLGTPGLFYKNPNSLGLAIVNDLDNELKDQVYFTVNSNNENIDYSKPSFYTDCSNPITLSYVNSNVHSSLIVRNGTGGITFDGSLLKKANTKLENISATINFTIHIINANNDEFTCDVSLPIVLEDDKTSIYNGHFVQEIEQPDEYKFTKVKK